jgi:hypothetical protein
VPHKSQLLSRRGLSVIINKGCIYHLIGVI